MRMAFGFVALLVTVGLIIWLFSLFSIPTARTGRQVQEDVRGITGRAVDGVPDQESVTLQPKPDASRPTSMLVTAVTAGGAMDHYYGLRAGDLLLAVNWQGLEENVRDLGTVEEVKLRLADAVQRQKQLIITRNGRRMTLTVRAGMTADHSAPPPPTAPATGAQDTDESKKDGGGDDGGRRRTPEGAAQDLVDQLERRDLAQ